ncbi:5088_t:CDS:2, partial [Racocetra fulgida]
MPEVDDYFREVDVNKWSYDGFLKFLTTEKCSEEIWISSLRAISKNKKYPDYILDINRLSNSLQKNETHFLRNLFPPVNIEVDEEVNRYLDNIFSIFKGEEESKE